MVAALAVITVSGLGRMDPEYDPGCIFPQCQCSRDSSLIDCSTLNETFNFNLLNHGIPSHLPVPYRILDLRFTNTTQLPLWDALRLRIPEIFVVLVEGNSLLCGPEMDRYRELGAITPLLICGSEEWTENAEPTPSIEEYYDD